MGITITDIESADFDGFTQAGTQLGAHATALQQHQNTSRQAVDGLSAGWAGQASQAAIANAGRTLEQHQQLTGAVQQLQSVLTQGGAQLAASRTTLLQGVQQLTGQGWQVSPDGAVSVQPGGLLDQLAQDSPVTEMRLRQLAATNSLELKKQLADLQTQDQQLAQRLRDALTGLGGLPEQGPGDGDPDQPQPDDSPEKGTTTPADQLPLPTKGGHEPFPTEATRDNDSPDPAHHLGDNPNAAPLLAGLSADEWRERLANYQPGDPLPDPRTPTGDKAIDALANAAGQQNTTYAWGGNKSPDGPSQGQPDNGDGANQNHDWDRYGYDCGGLVRYAVQQGAGFDTGMGTDAIDTNPQFSHPAGGVANSEVAASAQAGDVLIFGGAGNYQGGGTSHTGIYIGNGYMINAPESGQPVRVEPVAGHGRTDILRIP